MISSLQSDRLTKRLGTGRVTALSVLTTAVALFGFSVSHSFAALCLWAIPYGLGAGSVDASLNNYVALHYASRHMSWLHCMWGLGASLGPYIMGYALTDGGWSTGYRIIALLQFALAAALLLTLPLWKTRAADAAGAERLPPLPLKKVIRIPGAKEVMAVFFCYCAVEQTAILWASSYLALRWGLSAQEAASHASLFFVGITAGRALSGFLTLKFNDAQMIRLGQAVLLAGVLCLLLPFGTSSALTGLVLVGLGCAPVYPSIIHSTPDRFGADQSQAIIGIQMASAYVGTCLMPPLFGLIANHISVSLLPPYLLVLLAMMALMHERLLKATGKKA